MSATDYSHLFSRQAGAYAQFRPTYPPAPVIDIETTMQLADQIGYFNSWSATQAVIREQSLSLVAWVGRGMSNTHPGAPNPSPTPAHPGGFAWPSPWVLPEP